MFNYAVFNRKLETLLQDVLISEGKISKSAYTDLLTPTLTTLDPEGIASFKAIMLLTEKFGDKLPWVIIFAMAYHAGMSTPISDESEIKAYGKSCSGQYGNQ